MITAYSTGIPALDKALGKACKGLAAGTMTEVVGSTASGVTAVALAIASWAAQDGGDLLYLDPDGGVGARAQGFSPVVPSPDEVFGLTKAAIRRGVRVVVVDSVNNSGFGPAIIKSLREELMASSTALVACVRETDPIFSRVWQEKVVQCSDRVFRTQLEFGEQAICEVRVLKDRIGRARDKVVKVPLENGLLKVPGPKVKKPVGLSRFEREDVI